MDDKFKKILILIDTNVGGKGGAETHLWNLLGNLDKKRVSVDVIYFDADELDEKVLREQVPGVEYYRIPLRKIYSLSSVKYFKNIYKIMKSGNYDCVMSLFESSDIVTAVLARLAGIKKRISNRRDTGFRSSYKLRLVYRLINKSFSDFIAVSEAVKSSIIEQGVMPDKIQVVYNSVDVDRFKDFGRDQVRAELGLSDDALIFGMVANLNPVKNHTSVIDALSELHKQGIQPHLILAGQGTLRTELETKVKRLGLRSFVHFLGARNDIENILAAIDVFILASYTEGLSNALLEAMAAKKAVIASRVGGNVEVIEDGISGILVSTETSSIAGAMCRLAQSDKLRNELAEKAFMRVRQRFSIDNMLKNYMHIFTSTLSSGVIKGQTVSSLSD